MAYTAEHLDAAVKGVKGNQINFVNKGKLAMPAKVKVNYTDGTNETLKWNGRDQTLAAKEGGRIKNVQIDPDEVLLDLDRTNNTWPRHLNIKPVPVYLPIYDITALMPDE